ncbi:hypothetical protein AURDEDRAFT_118769 [Auricularia subglabra TFB-10046 SS5]|nr:hypothetical protein AURDEDRAFT_118769 [Auricularia subglabra TFB-10046 SS5]
MSRILLVVAALIASVVSLHFPTRSTPVDGLSNAERLAKGFAPAWPESLQHYSRSRYPSRRDPTARWPWAERNTDMPAAASPAHVVLTNPTPLYVGNDNWDDLYQVIVLPFPIQIYDRTSTTIFVSTNGLLSFDSGSPFYYNLALPELDIPPYTVLSFWDDTYISVNTNQGIYYQIFNGDTVSIEYFFSHYQDRARYFHYTVTTSTTNPGVFIVNYYEIADNGASATVGAQGGGQYVQYSFMSPVIQGGTALIIDTLHNTAILDGNC